MVSDLNACLDYLRSNLDLSEFYIDKKGKLIVISKDLKFDYSDFINVLTESFDIEISDIQVHEHHYDYLIVVSNFKT